MRRAGEWGRGVVHRHGTAPWGGSLQPTRLAPRRRPSRRMRFLLDQNADRRFAPYLRDLGHGVTVVSIDYPPGIPDCTVLAIAHREGHIVLTNDHGFGELVFRHRLPHAGVIYLRLY